MTQRVKPLPWWRWLAEGGGPSRRAPGVPGRTSLVLCAQGLCLGQKGGGHPAHRLAGLGGGARSTLWFAYHPWATAAILEGLCGDLWEEADPAATI